MLAKGQLIFASVVLSFIVSFIILWASSWIFQKGNKRYSFLDLARGSDGWPSLSRFQFLCWTLVVIFCFTTVALIKCLGGVLDIPGKIPENLLLLMGISVAVTPISAYVSTKKYGELSKPGDEITSDYIKNEKRKKKWESMLLENKRPSLPRFQMFSWTILSILLYLAIFFSTLKELDITKLQDLSLPDIDSTLVGLMGLSQVAYVGGKSVSPSKVSITGIYPEKVIKGKTVTIRGANLGIDKGSIIIGKETIISKDEIKEWDENRIDFIVPNIPPEEYDVILLIGTKEIKKMMVDTDPVPMKIKIEEK